MPTFTSTVTRSHGRPTTGHNRERRPRREFVAVKRDLISPQSFGEPFKDMLGDFTTKPLPKAPTTEQVKVFMDQNRPAPPRPYASRKDLEDAGWETYEKSLPVTPQEAPQRPPRHVQSLPLLRATATHCNSSTLAKQSSARRNDLAHKTTFDPLAMRDEIRHQIPARTGRIVEPSRVMTFEDRIARRRRAEERTFLHSDSDEAQEKTGHEERLNKKREKTPRHALEASEMRNIQSFREGRSASG